jgi:hypothetical protein
VRHRVPHPYKTSSHDMYSFDMWYQWQSTHHSSQGLGCDTV